MLQCHPHPGEFSDKSKPLHCSYFMGLQRKQGVPVNEGEQFDIRLTVEEFKHAVGMYILWKPGMEIHVTHVRRRNIPNYVFPGGVRPIRPVRLAGESRRVLEPKVPNHAETGKALDESDKARKRKQEDDITGTNSRTTKCVVGVGFSSEGVPENGPRIGTGTSFPIKVENNLNEASELKNPTELSSQNGDESDESVKCSPPVGLVSANPGSSSSREAEKIAIEKIMAGPYGSHQAFAEELEELEDDLEYKNQVKNFGGTTKGGSAESFSMTNEATTVPGTTTARAGPCSSVHLSGSLEELEVLSTKPVTLYQVFNAELSLI